MQGQMKRAKMNRGIKATYVLLIDQDGNNLGKVKYSDAMAKASEYELDLVEVSPGRDKTPVCRIMDYGKWKYEQSKKIRKNKSNQHKTTVKELKFRPNTGKNDLEYRAVQADRFLKNGHSIKLVVRYKGREYEHMYQTGRSILERFLEMITEEYFTTGQAGVEGRALLLFIHPGKKE